MAEMILPGTYIEVRDEGLISAGRISTGNIGIVGTAPAGPEHEPVLISSLSEAREKFGHANNSYTLLRSLELIYQNGGRTVYAVKTGTTSQYAFEATLDGTEGIALTLRAKFSGKIGNEITIRTSAGASEPSKTRKVEIKQADIADSYEVESFADLEKQIAAKSRLVEVVKLNKQYQKELPSETKPQSFIGGSNSDHATALETLENEIVNIVVLAGQDTQDMNAMTALTGHLARTAGIKRERLGVMGIGFRKDKKNKDAVPDDMPDDVPANERLILVSPGLKMIEGEKLVNVSAGYLAAAITGIISSLPVHTSPTNKTLTLSGLSTEFNSAELTKRVSSRILAVEKRDGFRIVKGITTHDGAWQQITTRRIVDYAIYGVRSGCNPYIGKLNNVRVRGAMKATLDGFLTRMVENEALTSYQLEVSATRAQEIAGEAIVTMTLSPTFSIDFVKVTMYLS